MNQAFLIVLLKIRYEYALLISFAVTERWESLIISISTDVNERVCTRRLIQVNFASEFECKSAVTLCNIQLRTIR